MSNSATRINYETRSCKFVERRMLLASLSRILGTVRKEQEYQYIGFGGLSFADFKLFHRELQIDKMFSIEEGYSEGKLQINKPFHCIEILRGKSTEVLPNIDLSIPSLIWLDYDGVLQNYMFEDIETIFYTIPPGSIFIISCNRELKKCNYEKLEDISENNEDSNVPMSVEELKVVFEDLVPFDIPNDACTPTKSHETIKNMLYKQIEKVLNDRNLSKQENVNFRLLYNIVYQEYRGAKMYTYGGIIYDDDNNINNVYLEDFDFIAKNTTDVVYKIDVPVLTHRETLALNKILFDKNNEEKFVESGIITESDLNKYKKIYKYCPSFHDVRI